MRLYEDYFDNVEQADIVRDIEDSDVESKHSVDFFKHHIDVHFTRCGEDRRMRIGFTNICKMIFDKYLGRCEYITDYMFKVRDLTDNKDYDNIEDACMARDVNYPVRKSLRVYFNTFDNMSLRPILKVLCCLIKSVLEISKDRFFSLPGSFVIDDNYNFSYCTYEYQSIMNRYYERKDVKKNIKHFIALFNRKRAVSKKLDEIMSENGQYLGVRAERFVVKSLFVDDEDFKKVKVYNENGDILIHIPKGVTVNTHCDYRGLGSIKLFIKVDGKMIVRKYLAKGDAYHFNNKCLAPELIDNYQHNEIVYNIDFENNPFFTNTTAVFDMKQKSVNSITVHSTDKFVDDENELMSFVSLKNEDNVADIKYVVDEL